MLLFLLERVFEVASEEVLKHIWDKSTQKTFEDLFVDACKRSIAELKISSTSQDVIELDESRLRRILQNESGSNVSYSQLTSDNFVSRIAQVFAEQDVIIVGGHSFTNQEYLTYTTYVIEHARVMFNRKINEMMPPSIKVIREEMGQGFISVLTQISELQEHLTVQQQVDTSPLVINSDEALTQAIYRASSLLRNERYQIQGTDEHLHRPEVQNILDWMGEALPGKRFAAIAGLPGDGKTVLMRSLYMQLHQKGIPILAIRADRLDDAKYTLNEAIGTDDVSNIVRHLTDKGTFVVIIDQLDRVASTSNTDTDTLYKIIHLIAELRDIPQLYLIVACRKFELDTDPELSRLAVNKVFLLDLLPTDEVDRVLAILKHPPLSRLSGAFQKLLRKPIFLTNYAQLLANQVIGTEEHFSALQELYSHKWEKDVLSIESDAPPTEERKDLIYLLVDEMNNRRKYECPASILDKNPAAKQYLHRTGFIEINGGQVSFLHQTLFSYCDARKFVDSGQCLRDTIVNGCQGFFQRPKMIQVLEYLRSQDPNRYVEELETLLFSDGTTKPLGFHLRILLLQWLGQLPNPNTQEKTIVNGLLDNFDDTRTFLVAARGNSNWFSYLMPHIKDTLKSSDDTILNTILNYIVSFRVEHVADVISLLQPYLGKDSKWDNRIVNYIWRIDDWSEESAIEITQNLIQRGCVSSQNFGMILHSLSESNVEGGCKILRKYLDQLLQLYKTAKQHPNESNQQGTYYSNSWELKQPLQRAIDEYHIQAFVHVAARNAPYDFIMNLLDWVFAVELETISVGTTNPKYYPSSYLFRFDKNERVYGNREGLDIETGLVVALQKLLRIHPSEILPLLNRLSQVELHLTQIIVVRVFLSDPDNYAAEIYKYLIGDSRRLHLSDVPILIGKVFPHLEVKQRLEIEMLIRSLKPRENTRSAWLWNQEDMFRLLYFISPDLLSYKSYYFLMELQRKFPRFVSDRTRGEVFIRESIAPVPIERLRNLSDKDYLRVLRRYDDTTDWDTPGHYGGGVVEQSRKVSEHAREEPERLYKLAFQFDDTISNQYITAIISGIANSDEAPTEWIRHLIINFGQRITDASRMNICSAVQKRPEKLGDIQIIELLMDWIANDSNPEKETEDEINSKILPETRDDSDGWINKAINSVRGTAFESFIFCTLKAEPPKTEIAYELLLKLKDDPALSIQVMALNGLAWWHNITRDNESTINLFQSYINQNPILLTSHYAQNLLSWLCAVDVNKALPYLEAMLKMTHDWTREAAAQIICFNSFRQEVLHTFVDNLIVHDDVHIRRGAASIYARNIEFPSVTEMCQEKLLALMLDDDEVVRQHVGSCFTHLRKEHLVSLQSFIEKFVVSPAARINSQELIDFILRMRLHQRDFPYILRVIRSLVHNIRGEISDGINRRIILSIDKLLVFLRNISETYSSMCEEVMDIFDDFIKYGEYEAIRLFENEDKEWRQR